VWNCHTSVPANCLTLEQNDQSCDTTRHTCPMCKRYFNVVQLVWHVLAFLVSVVFKKINMAVNMLMFDMEGYFFI